MANPEGGQLLSFYSNAAATMPSGSYPMDGANALQLSGNEHALHTNTAIAVTDLGERRGQIHAGPTHSEAVSLTEGARMLPLLLRTASVVPSGLYPRNGTVMSGSSFDRQSVPTDRGVSDLSESRRRFIEKSRPTEDADLTEWSNYFDRYWKMEGLPQDWYNLRSLTTNKRIGFVMRRELASLGEPGDVNRQTRWFPKAERNLAGFKLEFLSDHIVYPRQYYRSTSDPTRLVDPFYSDGSEEDDTRSDIVALVSPEERNGSVHRSVGEIKRFLLDAPVGSMTVMVSPLGPTGFKSDDGLGEDYADSYIFIDYKNGKDKVINYTIKTNFTLRECRTFIEKVSGKSLHPGARLEEYVEAIAKIKPGESKKIKSIFDVVALMKEAHPDEPFVDEQTKEKTTWGEVIKDLHEGEALYNFEKKANGIIRKFRQYGEKALYHSSEAIHKATAAAILLLSDDYYNRKEQEAFSQTGVQMQPGVDIIPGIVQIRPFGKTLDQASLITGCTGSNSSSTVTTLGGELVTHQGGEGKCPDCNSDPNNGHYHCTDCKTYYDDERLVDREHRTPKCKECNMPFNC